MTKNNFTSLDMAYLINETPAYSCYVMSHHFRPSQVMPCHTMTCQITHCDIMPCHVGYMSHILQ